MSGLFFLHLRPMRQIKDKKNLQYAFFSVIFTILTNQAVYQGSKLINLHYPSWDVSFPVDYTFKFYPWTLSIYIGAYFIWFVSYFIIAMQDDRAKSERFFSAILLSRVFLTVIFIALPTSADIRTEITGTSFWENFARLIYGLDPPINYFPSLHCMASWFCFIGVRGKKEFPIWWQVLSFILAIAVFISTITTRQHVIIDIPGGIVFAELCYAMSDYKWVHETYTKISTFFMRKLFHWTTIEG